MIDLSNPKGRLLAAALDLAKTSDWREITILQIAQGANMSLHDFKQQFTGKSDLLRYFAQAVDDAVIKSPPAREDGETPRDRLFEVIMNRFDVMAPYKQALKSIVRDGGLSPRQLQAVCNSQYWMLQAAGIATDGIRGQARVAGLMAVYAAVFRKWLDDDDAGLARTMAALDRRLRRGETTLARIDDACAGLSGALKGLRSFACCCGGRRADDTAEADGEVVQDAGGAAAGAGAAAGGIPGNSPGGDPAPGAAGAA